MKFKVTPLGGTKRSIKDVVAGIVDYLVAPTEPGSQRQRPTRKSAEAGGPSSYYADRGEEPGRWLGKGATELGLSGPVTEADFASVLGGRDPSTGTRLLGARGSAGRRPRLGVGSATQWDKGGDAIYDLHDAAAALEIDDDETDRLVAAGTQLAAQRLFGWMSQCLHEPSEGSVPGVDTSGNATGTPSVGTGTAPLGPGISGPSPGLYLVPVIDVDGRHWVTDGELTRFEDVRAVGVAADEVAAAGHPDDQLSVTEAARIAGTTPRYLRRLAKRYEDNREMIEELLASGRQPRQAFLVAHRGNRGRWVIKRSDLAAHLERRFPPAVRVGYDLTLTTEKSLSVLALLGSEDQTRRVLTAIQDANDEALEWLEGHAAATRIDNRTVPVEGWTVASFRHLTSRALDPFAHHHNVIANTVACDDGVRRTLDARLLYRNAKAASALATVGMRWRVTRDVGVRWRRRNSGWEIEGIPDEVLSEFSQRRTEVEDALRELEEAIGQGMQPSEIERLVLSTRPPKQQAAVDELQAEWWQRAAALGFDKASLDACCGHATATDEPQPDDLYTQVAAREGGICQNLSVFGYGDLLAHLANMPIAQADGDPQPLIVSAQRLEELAQGFLASAHVKDLGRGRYTTTEIFQVQQRVVKRYRDGSRQHDGAVVPRAALHATFEQHPHLTGEQQQLITAFCRSGQRIQCGIGRAGTGKTTAMRAAADAWTQAGWRVVGAAVKGEAARILGNTTGIPTETLAWWLAHPDPHTVPLDARTVLVVDEASTISDRDLDRLGWLVEQTGTTLRLIGDPAQHSSVEAGGMFRVLCERDADNTPELTRNMRLRDPNDHAAAEALRAGDIDKALDHLHLAGHLHVVEDELDFYRQVLTQWWQAHLAGQQHPMVDRRNSVRRQLNRLAHRLLQANGELGPEEITASADRHFAVGDRVIARAPARDLHVNGEPAAYLRNGATGLVTEIHKATTPSDDALTVAFDGIGSIRVPRAYFDEHSVAPNKRDVGLDHGYAVTSYAVEGSTHPLSTSRVDERSNRPEAYVDITRGTDANHLYLTRPSDPLDGEHLPRTPPPSIDSAVARRLGRSQGERTAWEIAYPQTPEPDDQESGLAFTGP